MHSVIRKSFIVSAAALTLVCFQSFSNTVHGQTITYLQKLDLNPTPFSDGNAYWTGLAKSDSPKGIWDFKITMHESAKNPANGVITISGSGWVFVATNKMTGATLSRTFKGTITAATGVVSMYSDQGDTLQGIVRAWWKVKGVRQGPMVIQGVITLNN